MAEKKTVSSEDYLEAILNVKREKGTVTVSAISEALAVTKPSVSYAIKKLVEQGLVEHETYGSVDLTPRGKKLARNVAAKHELLTVFISDILGARRQDAEQEACRMEHAMSDETRDRFEGFIEFVLSSPRTDEWLRNLRYYQEHRKRSPECLRNCAEQEMS